MNLYFSHHNETPSKTKAAFYIYFLKGYADSGSSTIGFSINGTPVIAIFKDVIVASGSLIVQKFVEQSTMIHEMGHALGFVNNGVPMAVPHQDSSHGAHTTNSNCVMYWLNEGASDLRTFVLAYTTSGDTTMWGPEVLADAQNYSQ